MLNKRVLLVIIDALRYDYSHLLNFDKYKKLTRVIATSNWTATSIMGMMTGAPAYMSKGGVLPSVDNEQLEVTELQDSKYHAVTPYKTLFQDFEHNLACVEIPFFLWMNSNPLDELNIDRTLLKMGLEAFQEARKPINKTLDKNSLFAYVHFKGPHEPYRYDTNKIEETAKKYKPIFYEKEILAMKQPLEDFITWADDKFDQIIIASDHGELLLGKDMDQGYLDRHKYGHGRVFNEVLVHTPVWVKEDLPDRLYANTFIYDLIKGNKIKSPDFVVSSSPVRGVYNRFSITYINSKEGMVTEEYITDCPLEIT